MRGANATRVAPRHQRQVHPVRPPRATSDLGPRRGPPDACSGPGGARRRPPGLGARRRPPGLGAHQARPNGPVRQRPRIGPYGPRRPGRPPRRTGPPGRDTARFWAKISPLGPRHAPILPVPPNSGLKSTKQGSLRDQVLGPEDRVARERHQLFLPVQALVDQAVDRARHDEVVIDHAALLARSMDPGPALVVVTRIVA